ncbi:DUF262 domain-containing protein [Pseudoalteromonas sp. H103]|uniref:DUF262 domain-containing protein n=1 Tax=Pseudoalteromonas sp. H103 TaxID=1761893 RepID=UPI0007321887|nr:DUF262 domain-containing protein [Pseudoalteromonas sp. H103]KTF08744.1 hypothetical protein ATS74_15100 [Pseudoalteromonas sp. H103]
MDVKPNYCSLETVFSENTLYIVPKFQRAYSWKPENVVQFTSDIESLYQNIASGNGEDSHFFGGIVCVKQKNENVLDDKTIYQLVDGQQRLSTTVLLVSRLINYLKSLKLDDEQSSIREKRIQKYKNKYLEFKTEENGKDVVFSRIELSRRDKEFYERFIIRSEAIEPSLESHKLIKSAAQKVDKWLSDFFKELTVDEVLKKSDVLFRVLSTACRILMIKMSDVNDAYRLFQVINDRGRSLTAGDLLRAASLGAFDGVKGRCEQELIHLENCWDRITNMDSAATNNKLIAYYTAKKGKACRKTALFEEFNKAFFQNPSFIRETIEDIDKDLAMYDKLHKGIWPYTESKLTGFQKKKLENLTVSFKHTLSLPLILAASKLKEKKFYQIIFYLEKFFFLFKVSLDKRMSPVTKLYHSTIQQINKDPEKYQVQNFLNGLKNIIQEKVKKEEFENYLNGLEYEIDGDNRSIKYLLSNIEENWKWVLGDNNNPIMMYKNAFSGLAESNFIFSIEHIYPKSAKKGEIVDDLEGIKNNLGNLCLLYGQDNSLLKNDQFKDKKDFYSKSRLNSTLLLATSPKFEMPEYSQRAEDLISQLNKIFFFGI